MQYRDEITKFSLLSVRENIDFHWSFLVLLRKRLSVASFTQPNVSRDLSRDGLILVHSHCQWFSVICACVHTQPVKTRDISCDVYNAPRTISLNWRTISASALIVRSSLIAASFQFTHFSSCERWSAFKTTVKQSNDKVRRHYDTPFTALIWLLFTQRSFRDWTRQCYLVLNPGSIPELILGRVCVHTEGTPAIFWQFSGTNVQCERG